MIIYEEEKCHCDKKIHTYEDGFSRGMCEECSSVRCDIEPGACGVRTPWKQFEDFRERVLADPIAKRAYERAQKQPSPLRIDGVSYRHRVRSRKRSDGR